ncbi:MAG: GGDEF domain-containing protein [Colwellia sp.]|nr:GGDEF domain-containing protein [Colwellia sp.]
MVTTYGLYLTNRTEKYLVDWTISGGCFLLSNILRAFGEDYSIPFFIIGTLANTCYMAGHVAIFTGVVRLTKNRNIRRLIGWAALIVVILHQFPLIQQSIENRMLLLFPMNVVLNIISLLYLWRNRNSSTSYSYLPLMFALSFYIFEISFRGILIFVDPAQFPMQGNQIMQTLGTLFLMIFLFMITISFVLIVNWIKEMELRKALRIDKLTGWLNRNDFDKLVSMKFDSCKQEKSVFGFVYFDIDHFKKINDKYGHSVGDLAIKHVCDLASSHTRNVDDRFRMGGEEFVICVSNTDIKTINQIAERIREELEVLSLVIDDKEISITISVGISISGEHDNSWESVLERADSALYTSKNSGRNRISQLLPEYV